MSQSPITWSARAFDGSSSSGTVSRSTVGNIETVRPRSAAVAATPESQLCHDELEDLYQRLGRTRGPFGSREGRAATRKAWGEKGWTGALWLLERARREKHLDVLDAVAEVLEEHGDRVVSTVATYFANSSAAETNFRTLLLRTAKLARAGVRDDTTLWTMGRDGARSPDVEVREAAYLLLGRVGNSAAREILTDALLAERNDAARETAREALEG